MYSQVNKGPARMARSQDLGKNSSLQFQRAVLDVQVLDIRFTGCCQLVREQTSAHTHVRHYDSPLDQISKMHSSTFMMPLLFFPANKFILVYTSYLFHLIKNCLWGRTESNLLILYSCYVITTDLTCGLVIGGGVDIQLPWLGVQWKQGY